MLGNTKRGMMWCFGFTNNYLQATRTICANYSQGNQVLFGKNAGTQCATMSLTAAAIYHDIEDINFWTSSTLNNIFTIANNLYMYISVRYSVQTNDSLLLLHKHQWNTRIPPFTKKSYLHRTQWVYYFYLSHVRILVLS